MAWRPVTPPSSLAPQRPSGFGLVLAATLAKPADQCLASARELTDMLPPPVIGAG
ncbi:hypothetical protein [Roseomonas xinghualingensis]|uniref:hypothetical protein n=1 Tax=Roseomonas xinghualingensis TaxID=2986475 RepID=UPI0021F123A3|nr:hypothetical protein [Roseomonas sp. SXEYE001]MCV4207526.1 hypothetical protein [Roseomonas sp. SXEYE001]